MMPLFRANQFVPSDRATPFALVFPAAVKVPPVGTPLIDGDIAFRQHDQGHVDGPNWSTFIEHTRRYFKSPGFKK